jgi:hypothetical protein
MESGPGVPGGMIGIVNEGMVLEVKEVVVCWSVNEGAFGVIGTIEIGETLMVGVV